MAMTREELIAGPTRNGWNLARWGHLKKEFEKGAHRIKLGRIAARHEISTPRGWARVASGYYKNLHITAGDQLAGMTR